MTNKLLFVSSLYREELELGHRSKECFNYMEAVCLGNKGHNVRATYDKTGLGPEEQVFSFLVSKKFIMCVYIKQWFPISLTSRVLF